MAVTRLAGRVPRVAQVRGFPDMPCYRPAGKASRRNSCAVTQRGNQPKDPGHTIEPMPRPAGRPAEIDYDRALHLDAEDLAEQGIQDAYRTIVPYLLQHAAQARPVTETIDSAHGHYSVAFDDHRYVICGPGVPEADSWGRAAHALFSIANRQLTMSEVRFFALNGGNDLFGIFLSQAQAERARRTLPRKRDWPYLPTPDPPWFGMFHA
jgi:hypothetical protein